MALSRHHAAATRPLSVAEIVKQAQDFDFSINVSLQRWIRAGRLLLTEAANCEQDGNLQMAYLYLYRHTELVLNRMPTHPDYREPLYQEDLSQARRAVRRNFDKLEAWKPRITLQYERYATAVERRNAERRRMERERQDDDSRGVSPDELLRRLSIASSEDGAYDEERRRSLNANEHRELAVDLAHREIRRRDANRATTRQAGISPGTVASRRRGIVADPSDGEEVRENGGYEGDYEVRSGVREAGRHLYGERQRQSQPLRRTSTRIPASNAYLYPNVPTKESAIDWTMSALQPASARNPAQGPPPPRPSKEYASSPPIIPPKQNYTTRPPSPRPTAIPSPTEVPSKYTFKPTAFTESGHPLRPLLLPPDLRTTFTRLAQANTSRNLETCGILCGTLISSALFISHLILPDQNSTSDTCDTTETGDNALFDYCDSHDLLVCGWIHTHPSQSCFLSSRDLHTSSGYQVMLPEAIAIVCAPAHRPSWGVFRLTSPPGLQAVLECREKGLFHPHAESDLYTDALKPGHVVEGPGLKFEVVDLRRVV